MRKLVVKYVYAQSLLDHFHRERKLEETAMLRIAQQTLQKEDHRHTSEVTGQPFQVLHDMDSLIRVLSERAACQVYAQPLSNHFYRKKVRGQLSYRGLLSCREGTTYPLLK